MKRCKEVWAWYRPETRMWKFSEDEMADGFVLMGVGMTTVFAFLSLLVGAMWAQAAFSVDSTSRYGGHWRVGVSPDGG